MFIRPSWILCLIGIAAVATKAAETTTVESSQAIDGRDLEFFEREVRPVLAEHCYECHSTEAERVEGNLWLDSRASHLRGGDSGPAIIAGDADASLLIAAVRYESYEMPPQGKLSDREIETLKRWVEMGAPWPKEATPQNEADRDQFDLEKRKSEFWVWQPIGHPTVPDVEDTAWPANPIDHFTLAGLERAGLEPARDADPTAVLRRLSFDLIGLPPTPAEIKSFVHDDPAVALDHAVDRLLASPHFGERWGRHWLDLVRYAESRGHEFDNDIPNAFQYRDYVVRAFNDDVPYDQLVREHIAGDLLPHPRHDPSSGRNESVLGTGFWFLGEWVHSPVDIRKDEADRFDNMLDVMSKTFLGVTVACARCHDHKFDAISTADYYSLSGFLQSSDYRQVRFESMRHNHRVATQLAEVDDKFQKRIARELQRHGIRRPNNERRLTDDAIIVDFASVAESDLLQDGVIFGLEPRRPGLAYLSDPVGPPTMARFGAVVNDPIWSGLRSVTEGAIQNRSAIASLPKSGRTLRSPTFELSDGRVSCRVEGAGTIVACVDSHRLVAGPLHKQTIVAVKPGSRWTTLHLDQYIGHRLHLEFIPAVDKTLSVRMVCQGVDDEGLVEFDRRMAELDQPFEQYANAAEEFFRASNDAVETIDREPTQPNDEVSDGSRDVVTSRQSAIHRIVQAWRRQRQRLASQIIRTSRLAPAMMDGTGEDDRVLIRGHAAKPGRVEPRHFLTAISGDSPMAIQSGSGRLQLADQICDPNNPLTARVIVNRIWHHLMGRGIVATTDDFGFLGRRPTHPQLLDHLARRFLQDGQSIKRMIRYIVSSRAYRMSSMTSEAAIEVDPNNLLWHHQPPRRLQGEVIRDSLLAVSGRLDRHMGGPPVPVHLTAFMNGRGRPASSGPLDGEGRRSLYTAVRRNFISPFMLVFDTPTPFSAMGRRNVSNVPAQALALLNDPMIHQLSRTWGDESRRSVSGNDDAAAAARIEWLYQSGFGRSPTQREVQVTMNYLTSQAATAGVALDDAELWSGLAHALVNTKEFIFLR